MSSYWYTLHVNVLAIKGTGAEGCDLNDCNTSREDTVVEKVRCEKVYALQYMLYMSVLLCITLCCPWLPSSLLPVARNTLEEFIFHFWRSSSLIGSADTAQKVYRFTGLLFFALFTIKYFYIKVHYKDGKSKLNVTNNKQ